MTSATLQPLFGRSVDSLGHPWLTATNLSYRFPILKLQPQPCAVLLVRWVECGMRVYTAQHAPGQHVESRWRHNSVGCNNVIGCGLSVGVRFI